MRRFNPQSKEFNERGITRDQKTFTQGILDDIAGSDIPIDGLKYSENYIIYPDRAEPRGGSQAWSNTTLPALPGRTGYSLTKTGSTVTKTVGTDFNATDIGNYVVYDDGVRERITGVTSTTVVTVENTDAHAASVAAWIRGPVNCTFLHRTKKQMILHIDTRIFVADINITAYTQAYNNCYYWLDNSISKMTEMDNYVIIFNANGIFKLDLDKDPAIYFKMNTRRPTVLITSVAESKALIYGRKYVYGMARLSGNTVTRNRTTTDIIIEQQSGPCEPNTSYIDYGTVFTSRPVGDGGTTFGRLTGAAINAAYDTAAELKVVTDAQFRITIGGTAQNIEVDFSGITSMAEAALRIQNAIREYGGEFATATCEYSTATNRHFILESPIENGALTAVAAGDAGTNMVVNLGLSTGAFTTPVYDDESSIGILTMPVDEIDVSAKLSHWTHYVLYCTLDIGINGIDPITGKVNNKHLLIWNADVPIAKAFIASRTLDTVTATAGEFQPMDVGSYFSWQDGSTDLISTYVNSTTITTAASGAIASQAACIGYGDIMTASLTGTTVTRTAGHTFVAGDVGKTLFWANGNTSIITAYTDANTVTVAVSGLIASTAVTLDPVSRYYYDSIDDTILRSRIAGFSLPNRFNAPMPDCNTGEIIGMFMFGAIRGNDGLYYCQLPAYQNYLGGYYNQDKQVAKFKDAVWELSEFTNELSVKCANSTHAISTNTFNTITIPEVGEVLAVIASQREIDGKVGCKNYGSIRKIGSNIEIMLCSDGTFRKFNGQEYSADLAYNRISKKLKKLASFATSSYDVINGYIVWCTETEPDSEADPTEWEEEYDDEDAREEQYEAEDRFEESYT